MFNRFFARKSEAPSVPEGMRVYAVGDIHGRADLLEQTIAMIDHDSRDIDPLARTVIFLGDYVDRGPASSRVLSILVALRSLWPNMITLSGNHEELFLLTLQGDERAIHPLPPLAAAKPRSATASTQIRMIGAHGMSCNV